MRSSIGGPIVVSIRCDNGGHDLACAVSDAEAHSLQNRRSKSKSPQSYGSRTMNEENRLRRVHSDGKERMRVGMKLTRSQASPLQSLLPSTPKMHLAYASLPSVQGTRN
jgi:hypothetical protein